MNPNKEISTHHFTILSFVQIQSLFSPSKYTDTDIFILRDKKQGILKIEKELKNLHQWKNVTT